MGACRTRVLSRAVSFSWILLPGYPFSKRRRLCGSILPFSRINRKPNRRHSVKRLGRSVRCACRTISKQIVAKTEAQQQQTVACLHISGLGHCSFTTAVNYMGTLMAFPGLVLERCCVAVGRVGFARDVRVCVCTIPWLFHLLS
ncbi:uncharacterized protein BDZ99DRAFT_257651 [Mytilinidion resinicola]|uniref:Uncharacterized protein n=1 Tax=Mytilinidion resinicola TaxID=574789 RepID=A0A6A6YY64_9PEZI|nr:uncharacterized protein BDZ99DRAFT_257651 [Mytilinidion resinicola]KAF2813488.1 hypothetical protein BDZ99DRAFT_257651 [Mytilinidion resinicola]